MGGIFFTKKSDNWALPKVWDANQVAVVSESKANETENLVESFTIQIENISNDSAELSISWENTKVTTLINVPTHEKNYGFN